MTEVEAKQKCSYITLWLPAKPLLVNYVIDKGS